MALFVTSVVVMAAVGALIVRVTHRNRRLLAWAKSVPITPAQTDAMRALWASRTTKPPTSDPLDALTEEELADMLRICGASFRPREFGDASSTRAATFRNFKRRGFSDRQAAILTGMSVNMVGRV